MTKREFDRATKVIFHGQMASDERAGYRSLRMKPQRGWRPDMIERRGAKAFRHFGSKWASMARSERARGKRLLWDVSTPALP